MITVRTPLSIKHRIGGNIFSCFPIGINESETMFKRRMDRAFCADRLHSYSRYKLYKIIFLLPGLRLKSDIRDSNRYTYYSDALTHNFTSRFIKFIRYLFAACQYHHSWLHSKEYPTMQILAALAFSCVSECGVKWNRVLCRLEQPRILLDASPNARPH